VITFGAVITGLWFIFLAYWFVAAIRAKRSIRTTWSRGTILRAAIAVGILLLLLGLRRLQVWRHAHTVTIVSPIIASVGVAVCALGIALAIWARTHLGRNWGMPMSLREGHELVTTGPYAFVRHPIYTGILLALIGTALVEPSRWIVVLGAFGYFVFAAIVEERTMTTQFPLEYPGYLKRTKMLFPFLL